MSKPSSKSQKINKLQSVLTFAAIDIRRTFRDKTAVFFVFLFPLIFLFVFGGIFGGNNDTSFKIALINESNSEFSKRFVTQAEADKLFKIDKSLNSRDQIDEKMNRGEIDAAIILPQNFGEIAEGGQYPSGEATVLYTQNNETAGQTLGSILTGIFKGINSQFVQQSEPFTVKSQSTATESQRRFDYTFAGLLGFSIMGLGIFGPTQVFPQLKKQGVLRRFSTTPLRVWQFFVSNVLSAAFMGILSIVLLFVVAVLVFDLNMNGDYISLGLLTVLGVAVLYGIGLAIGGWADNEQQAAPLANLVTFPMMFLSGTFFPRFLMPEWLQSVSGFLPLTPIVDGARLIITEGKTIFDLGPQVGILAVWGILVYFVAFKVFRWE